MVSSVSAMSGFPQAAPQFAGNVTAKAMRQVLSGMGCSEVRQKGSHLIMQTAAGHTLPPIPVHTGDMSPGVIRSIANALGISKQQLERWAHHPKDVKQAMVALATGTGRQLDVMA